MGFSSILKSRALLPQGDGSRSSHMDWNSCSSSDELGARYVQPHQNTIKRPHLQAWTWHLSWILAVVLSLWRNKKVCGCSVQLHLSRIEIVPGFARTAGAARRYKKVVGGMASCFTILTRITRLKCVNSEVGQSAFTLKRVPSSGSMAPCRGHHGSHTRQEMDHWSDPLGTESLHMQLD